MPSAVTAAALVLAAAGVAGAAEVQLPRDTVACDLSAWSRDDDPAGLNLRAGPTTGAAVLGRLPKRRDGAEGVLVEMHVIGFKDGWFLIENPTYGDYGDPPPKAKLPTGRGWVHGSKLGGQLLGTTGRLRDTPSPTAGGTPVGPDADAVEVVALLACRGRWVRIESGKGTGWVEGLCSNQVTTCP